MNKVELNETKNQLTHKLRYGINKFTNSQIVDKLNIKKISLKYIEWIKVI